MNTDINTNSLSLPSSVSICAPSVANTLPVPQANVSVRVATIEDLPFIDGLQKVHRKGLGFLKMPALVGKVEKGEILIAEEVTGHLSLDTRGQLSNREGPTSDQYPVTSDKRLGYIIGVDRYFKHDDVGIIYQLNVVPGRQRKFVGAALLNAMFDRAAYGCRLFCCWCAQDLAANKFWEAMGFVPIAFRAGSEKKRRVHIFWQKRIREGDTTTQWWYPSETSGGSMGENRLALPIPPGKHWSDEMPVILPSTEADCGKGAELAAARDLRNSGCGLNAKTLTGPKSSSSIRNPKSEIRNQPKLLTTASIGLRFVATPVAIEKVPPAVAPSVPRKRSPKRKNDPKLIAAARELKDRWLEHVNAGGAELISEGKYDLTRALPEPGEAKALLLPAA